MKAAVFELSIPRYLAAKALGPQIPALYDGAPSCLSIRDIAPPKLPNEQWVRLAPIATGICGTDIATVYFKASPALTPYATRKFVPGHEVLARVTHVGKDVRNVREGDRVVVDPWLSCSIRGVSDCARCEAQEFATCERASVEPLKGMMLGASDALPGGFAQEMVAHQSQLFVVPDSMNDDRAVLAEPFAVAMHAILRNAPRAGERVLVLGGGPIAFATVAILSTWFAQTDVTLFSLERAHEEFALKMGAKRSWIAGDESLVQRAATLTNARVLTPELGPRFLAGGFDWVYDCVGSQQSITDAMGVSRGGGSVVMVGAAGIVPKLDLTHLWSKELRLVGTLAYGVDEHAGKRERTFAITREFLEGASQPLESFITHRFALDDLALALRTTLQRKQSGAVKTILKL